MTIQSPPATTTKLTAAAVLLLLLAGCAGDPAPAPEPEPEPEPAAATPAAEIYDDADVLNHVGIEGPGEYPFGDAYLAEYRWTTPTGDLCPISNVITSADDAAMAGDLVALNPAGTAGVELYDHTANAACIAALEQALEGLE